MDIESATIAVIGLGYVGLPLALAFGKERTVYAYDISQERIASLSRGDDSTMEASSVELSAAQYVTFTADPVDLKNCQVFIITVPTPIDAAKRPDLRALVSASRLVGDALQTGGLVIYESTVYPGCLEEVCAPILESACGLRLNEGFFMGYSPERINPGDKTHRLDNVVKVTSGSTPEAAAAVDALYRSVVTVGTHCVSSIKVAEAAKVIENTQRDLNIALMNELALIFQRLGVDTCEVLEAASTKWNFLPFSPGLVGGHCIGVDPYYLTHKAQEVGYHPEVILAGRRINDSMGYYAADQTARLMMRKGIAVVGSRILIMGASFKENCPDLRNSRVADIVERLRDYNAIVEIWEPWATPEECLMEFGISSHREQPAKLYDGIVVAVAHREFVALGDAGIQALAKTPSAIFDVKSVYSKGATDGRF